jgi:uncharacterized protein YcfL
MNRYLLLMILSLSLIGCSSTMVTHSEQLILNIPDELLEPPQPLNKL